MNHLNKLLLTTVIVGVISAQAAEPAVTSNRKTLLREVEAVNSQWNAAFNRGDVEALTAMYTADAIVMPPDVRSLANSDQIRSYWKYRVSSGYREHNIDVVDIHEEGRLIYEAGVWTATAASADGKIQRYGGNLVNVFERQPDGTLKSRLQSWN
jgi:ketosteroid isomerase-like protein